MSVVVLAGIALLVFCKAEYCIGEACGLVSLMDAAAAANMPHSSLPQLHYLISMLERMESFDMGSWYHLGPHTLVSVSDCQLSTLHSTEESVRLYDMTPVLSTFPATHTCMTSPWRV